MNKKYSTDEVIRMIKPNSYTYTGMSHSNKMDLQARYQEAKKILDAEGINTLLKMRLINLDKETENFPAFTRKSVLINAIRYGGLDGWENPHK